jgi:hypothetical protein
MSSMRRPRRWTANCSAITAAPSEKASHRSGAPTNARAATIVQPPSTRTIASCARCGQPRPLAHEDPTCYGAAWVASGSALLDRML